MYYLYILMPVRQTDKSPTREVVIIDDQFLFAEGLKKILETIPSVRVSAIIDDGNDTMRYLSILKPDVIFLDLNLPGMNGIEILEQVRSQYPSICIAILTMYEDQLLVKKARNLGANAYLSKNANITELKKAIFSTASDPFFVSSEITDDQSALQLSKEDSFKSLGIITDREKEIIKLIASGKNSNEISEVLYISRETVKTHRKNIFRKLGLKNTAELFKFVYENSLL